MGLKHVQHRGHHQVISIQIFIGTHDIHVHPKPEELFPDTYAGLLIFFGLPAQRFHVLNGPAVVPVEEHGGFGSHQRPCHRGNFFQQFPYFRHFLEDSCIISSQMIHHCAVELLIRASSLTPLEVLHGIRAAGHCLEAGQSMDAGTLKLVHILPIHQTRGTLHHHERHIPL